MLKFAHRGASGYAPENTMAAIKKAVEMGTKALEIDVQLTRDRKLVVIHDYDLKRTTNGRGFIMNKSLEKLKTLDAGSWYGKEYKGEPLPTLEEVFEGIPEDILVNIELKKFVMDKRNMTAEVLEVIKKYDVWDRVIISSFDHRLLERVREVSEKIKIGLLFDKRKDNLKEYHLLDKLKPYSIHINAKYIDGEQLRELKGLPYKIYSYTINEFTVAEKYEKHGLNGYFTDYPDIEER